MHGLIAIPTYNEIEALPNTLQLIFQTLPTIEVVIIDDDSPDGTAQWVQQQMDSHPYGQQLHLIHRHHERGFASAYQAACDYFLEGSWDYIQMMDADASHPIGVLPQFQEKLAGGADLVVGSRYIQGGGYEQWPWQRVMLSWLGQHYIRFCLGSRFNDWTSGFIAIRKPLLQQLPYSQFLAQGFAVLIEFKIAALEQNAQVAEIPIVFTNRELGESKISRRIILEGLKLPLRYKFM